MALMIRWGLSLTILSPASRAETVTLFLYLAIAEKTDLITKKEKEKRSEMHGRLCSIGELTRMDKDRNLNPSRLAPQYIGGRAKVPARRPESLSSCVPFGWIISYSPSELVSR